MATINARIRITRTGEPGALGAQLERPVNNLTGNIAQRMRRLVPKRSWRLHDTIERQAATRTGAVVTGSVTFGDQVVRGVLVNYHLMVERGTSRMSAQPYARPALYQSRSRDLVTEVVDR